MVPASIFMRLEVFPRLGFKKLGLGLGLGFVELLL